MLVCFIIIHICHHCIFYGGSLRNKLQLRGKKLHSGALFCYYMLIDGFHALLVLKNVLLVVFCQAGKAERRLKESGQTPFNYSFLF